MEGSLIIRAALSFLSSLLVFGGATTLVSTTAVGRSIGSNGVSDLIVGIMSEFSLIQALRSLSVIPPHRPVSLLTIAVFKHRYLTGQDLQIRASVGDSPNRGALAHADWSTHSLRLTLA